MEMSSARRPHFCHVYSCDSSSENLKIPAGFIKHMESRQSGTVFLTGPSGNMWHMDLIQHSDSLFFHRGWPEFVCDHLIEHGDLLVFRYEGELNFTVQVFDQSACEKEAAFHAKCNQECGTFDHHVKKKKREREEMVDSLDRDSERKSKKIRENSSKPQLGSVDKNQETGMDTTVKKNFGRETSKAYGEANSSQETKYYGTQHLIVALPSHSKSLDERKEMTIQRRIREDDLSPQGKGYMPVFSDPEEKKVAESFTSCFPYFVRTMKRFNVSGSYTLNVPYQFSMEYLPKCKTEIVLHNLKGFSWTVNSVPTTRVHTSHTFCGGWLAFVRNNEIEMGDICIFELVGKCEICVHIFRLGKRDDQDSPNGKAAYNELCCPSTVTSQKIFDGLPKKLLKNSAKVHTKSLKNVQICNKKVSKMLDKRKHGNATKNSAKPSRTGHEKPEACLGLRAMVAIDEEKAAQSFTSAYPNFVRIMKKFNISGSYTLKIPYQFSMAHLPNCKTKIILRNLRGDHWTVNSIPDSKGRVGHTFCGGWMAFVRGNDIKMGDVCIFELTSKWEMRVHISGHGKKGIEHQLGRSALNEMLSCSATADQPPT